MLIILPKLYKQKQLQIQLARRKQKTENGMSAISMKTKREIQRQILVSLLALPVSETLDKDSYADPDCKMACQVTCPQIGSGYSALKSWDITKTI